MRNDFCKEDIRKAAKGTGISLFGGIFGKGLFFITQVVIARILGVEAFGLYAIGISLVKICSILASAGLHTGGMRFVSLYQAKDVSKVKGTFIASISIAIMNGSFIGLALYFASPAICAKIFHKPELVTIFRLFSYSLPLSSTMVVFPYLLQGFHTTKYAVYAREIVQPSVNLFFILIFCFYGIGIEGVIYAFFISNAAGVMAAFILTRTIFPQLTIRKIKAEFDLKNLIGYSLPLLLVAFLHFFLSFIDTLMLGALGTTEEVGIYRAASQIPMVMLLFVVASNSIYAPIAADLYNRAEMERFGSILKTTTRWISYISLPFFIFYLFASKELMLLFGNKYVETGSAVLIILSFRQLVNCLTGGVGLTLSMTSRQNLEAFNSFAMLIMNIGFNFMLIPKYGVLGAAVSSCVSGCMINSLRVCEVAIIYRIHPFSVTTFKYAACSTITIAVLFLIKYIPAPAVASFTIKAVAICILTTLLFILFGTFNQEDKFVRDGFLKKARKLTFFPF